MITLLKKGKQGVITQLFSLDVQTSKASISPYFQRVLNKPSKVFEDIPISLPLVWDMVHVIHLIPGIDFSSVIP